MRSERTRVIVEIGLSVALATALSFTRLWQMPYGGTISFAMLPLFVVALRRGVLAGVIAGAMFGIIDYFLEPYVVHWIQFLLDYPVAHAAAGLAGLFSVAWRREVARGRTARAVWTIALPAMIVGAMARFAVHWLSGVVFFKASLGESYPGVAFALSSAIYNGVYVLPSLAICAVAAIAVLPLLERAVPVRAA